MDDTIDFTRVKRTGPPDDLWPAIAGDLDRRRRGRIARRISALAATITVVVLAAVMVEMPPPPDDDGPGASVAGVTLADLRAASARLESRLSDRRRSVVDGIELESLMWLEAELAWLDEQLADAPADAGLWRQRIELLQELNRRYDGSDWRREMMLASV